MKKQFTPLKVLRQGEYSSKNSSTRQDFTLKLAPIPNDPTRRQRSSRMLAIEEEEYSEEDDLF